MSGLQFFLNNQLSVPPKEWKALELELNWATGAPSASLSSTQFTFEGKPAHDINTWVSSGTAGGYGIFEGMPFRIIDCNNLTALNGCLDLVEGEYSCNSIALPVRDNRLKDYLHDRWDGFRFSSLADLPPNAAGRITQSDYINVPYCVSALPNYTQLLATGLQIYLITKEIAELVRKTGDIIAELAVPPVSIVGAVKLILQAAYLIVMIAALINLLNTFIGSIIQPVKYKKAMKVRTMIDRACAHLGLSFQSSILKSTSSKYYNAVIMPKKAVQPTPNYLGFKRPADESTVSTTYGYYEGTFGDLCRELETIFEGRFVQRGNIVYFERENNFNFQSQYVLPNIDLQGTNNGTYRYNAADLPSNYFYMWSLDTSELNTYDHYEGTSCQMQAKPNTFSDRKNILLNGLIEKRPGLALAKRKEVLTEPEKVMNSIYQLISIFVAVPPVNNRIGWLLLSSDYTSVPKFFIVDSSNKIISTNKNDTSATYLMNNYHFIRFPLNDQWIEYKDVQIPFCCDDYVTLLNNNLFRTLDGRIGKMVSVRWQIGTNMALASFKVRPHNNRYTNNINQTIISDLN